MSFWRALIYEIPFGKFRHFLNLKLIKKITILNNKLKNYRKLNLKFWTIKISIIISISLFCSAFNLKKDINFH